jgi:hypothetical protein
MLLCLLLRGVCGILGPAKIAIGGTKIACAISSSISINTMLGQAYYNGYDRKNDDSSAYGRNDD